MGSSRLKRVIGVAEIRTRALIAYTHGRKVFYFAGLFFIFAQCVILSALIVDPATRPLLFWLCNNFCFFLAIACFQNNMQFVKGISYIGLLPQLLWMADFLSHLIGFDLSNTTNYITIEGFTYANDVSIALHMCIPATALALSFRTRPEWRSLKYSIGYIAALYVATIAGTSPINDVNCVFNSCNPNGLMPYHILVWPLYVSIITMGGFAVHWALYWGWQKLTPKVNAGVMV